MPSKSVPKTPYEIWTGRKPELSHLGPWGCSGHIRVPSQMIGKLDPRALECIFVCYSAHSKGYVFVLERGGGELAEVESHDVEFY